MDIVPVIIKKPNVKMTGPPTLAAEPPSAVVGPCRLTGYVACRLSFDHGHELADILRENGVRLLRVLPVADRAVAMTKQEVSIFIRTNDAGFLAAPPRGAERSPFVFRYENDDGDIPIANADLVVCPQAVQRRARGIGGFHAV